MRRYGKKLDRGHTDKLARSNRGRTRTAATAGDRQHVNRGYRCGQEQTAEIRANKKTSRLRGRLSIKDELFDLELAEHDPEIWLHGTNLATFKDTIVKQYRCFITQHQGLDDGWDASGDWRTRDWDLSDTWDDHTWDDNARCPDLYNAGNDDTWNDDARYQDLYNAGDDAAPPPGDAAWRDLWVAGNVQAPQEFNWRDWDDEHYGTYDEEWDLENPLLESDGPATGVTTEAAKERGLEKLRAGERYFKQTGRTTQHATEAGPAWLVTREKQRVDPRTYRDLIAKAFECPAFKGPSKYTWELVRNVPIYELDPGLDICSTLDRTNDLLVCQGKKSWTIIVDQDGKILDGHHRLSTLNRHGAVTIDVLWIRPRTKR